MRFLYLTDNEDLYADKTSPFGIEGEHLHLLMTEWEWKLDEDEGVQSQASIRAIEEAAKVAGNDVRFLQRLHPRQCSQSIMQKNCSVGPMSMEPFCTDEQLWDAASKQSAADATGHGTTNSENMSPDRDEYRPRHKRNYNDPVHDVDLGEHFNKRRRC